MSEEENRQPKPKPLKRALPMRMTREGEVLWLRSSWFSGCMPLAYIFFVLALFITYILFGMEPSIGPASLLLFVLTDVPFVCMALWMIKYRVHWKIEGDTISCINTYSFIEPELNSAKGVKSVVVVEQYMPGRYEQLVPGIHVLTDRGSIDLGGNGRLDQVLAIAEELAAFYDVPFENQARAIAFETFRRKKLVMFLIAIPIGLALIALQKTLKS